jgi:hypothetical protein
MNSGPKSGSRSKVFWIAITFAAVLAWAFGFQTWAWHEARRMDKSDPCLALIPRSLPDESSSRGAAIKQTYFGYEFEAPWPRPVAAKQAPFLVDLIFHGDYAVVFFNPAERRNLLDDTTAIERHPNMKDAMAAMIGRDAAQSNYDFFRNIFNITPAQVLPTLSKREANRRLTLLRMKGIDCGRKPSAFYFFQFQNLRCFQIGDPAVERSFEVRCFDPSDHELSFLFGVRENSGLKMSQMEVNRVIQSLRPAQLPSSQPTGTNRSNN